MNKSKLNKHVIFTSSKDIDDICNPLKEFFNIDYFAYQRDTLDLTLTTQIAIAPLCSNAQVAEFLIDYKDTEPMPINPSYQSNYYLIKTYSPKWAAAMQESCKLNHFLCKAEKINDQQWNRYTFGTTSSDPQKLNFYLNNRDLLDKFIIYFKEKAANQISQAHKNEIRSYHPTAVVNNDLIINREKFLQQIQPKRYRLTNLKGNEILIPAREALCLRLMAQGRSAKETGNILKLSPRTVETNWKRSKERLMCYTKQEMLDILVRNNVRNL